MPQTPTRWRQMSPEERCGLAASYAMVSPWNVVGHRNLRYDSKGSQKKASLMNELLDGDSWSMVADSVETINEPMAHRRFVASFDALAIWPPSMTSPRRRCLSTLIARRPFGRRTHELTFIRDTKKGSGRTPKTRKKVLPFIRIDSSKRETLRRKFRSRRWGKKATLNNSATPRTERRWRRCSSGSIKSAPIIRAFEFDWVYFYMERTRFGCVTGDADWVARWRVSVWLRSPRIRFHGIAFLFLFCFSFFFSLSLSLFAANVSTERLRLFYVSIIAIGVRLFFSFSFIEIRVERTVLSVHLLETAHHSRWLNF